MNVVISVGVSGEGASAKSDWIGVEEPELRLRVKVCLKDAKLVPFDVGGAGGGEGGLLEGVDGTPDLLGGDMEILVTDFFLPAPKDRKNDHSDSNWMESNSLESGE